MEQACTSSPARPSTNSVPHSFPRKWKLHKQGRSSSCFSGLTNHPPQPGCCPNCGHVRRAAHTPPHVDMYTQRHAPQTHAYIGTYVHTCLHAAMCTCTHGTYTGKFQGGESNQPGGCARRENPVSCSSWTHQSLQGVQDLLSSPAFS